MDSGTKQSSGSRSPLLVPALIGAALALVIGGVLIAQFDDVFLADQASAEAEQVDQLFQVMLGIGGAIFLLVQGLLLFSVFAFRKRQGDEGDGVTIHGNVTLELIWTAIPAVIVLVLVIYSYQVWTDIREPKDDEMVVEVVGRRFAWTFSYEDNRVESPINSNTLHTYVGQPTKMVMHTEDVIHSFWVPEMRIKQDLLPGRTTEVRFTPIAVDGKASEDYPLQYRVVCTELCGSGHGEMYATILIHETEEDYRTAFLDPAVETVLNPPEDPVVRGGQLLASGAYPCSGCHVLEEAGDGFTIEWAGLTGPALEGAGDRAPTRVSGQTAEEYLYISLYDTDAYLVPGFSNLMVQFQADDPDGANYMPHEDARAIIAFLCTLTDTGESTCDLDNLDAFMSVDAG
jgi:cytochrome c oxidase subunit II